MAAAKKKKVTVKKKTVTKKKVALKKNIKTTKKTINKKTKEPKKNGRPTIFSKKLASEIIDRILSGVSVRDICLDPKMPGETTFFRWFHVTTEDKELMGFREQYVQAKAFAAELEADAMNSIADNVGFPLVIDGKVIKDDDGKMVMIKDAVSVSHAKLKIETRRWTVEKLVPKKFGTKLDVTGEIITKVIVKDMTGG